MSYTAKKIVIITEKFIVEQVCQLIEECGATGYTTMSTGGKGSRGVRSEGRGGLTDAYGNVKIEIIVADLDVAHDITNRVSETYFNNYSGITYMEDVEIVRPQKF